MGTDREGISYDIIIPEPPFWGDRIVRDLDLDIIFSYINESVLFRSRWGYRGGILSKHEYEALLENEVRPAFELLKQRCKAEKLLIPVLVYGYYPCNSREEQVIIYRPNSDEEWLRFNFPRQQKPPYRCIADFFLPLGSGQRDVIILQVVTVGYKASEESRRLFKSDQYKNYLMFHGLSVTVTEALAEYWHQKIRQELQIANGDGNNSKDIVKQKYRGLRYSFGYPACPDLLENRKIFEILRPERIGVTLTEGDQMVPEQTTSAFIVHHPHARYFRIH